MKCYTLLKEHGINYPEELSQNREMRDRQIRIVEEADKWMDGLAMHPTGVIMVEDAQRQGIPIVLCTDTYHHGYASQPIHTYAMEQGVKIIDSYNQMEGSAPSKDWPRAFDTLLKIIRPSQIEENPSSRKSRYA
jgi:hypothetical protein